MGNFPVTIEGRIEEFHHSATKTLPLGTVMKSPDGREFVYARAGAVDLAAGRLVQQAVVVSGHGTDIVVAAAAAIGATSVTITNNTTAIAANDYAEGYLPINDEAGEGYEYKVKSHPAADATASCVLTLEDEDGLRVALTTASQVGLRKHECDGVLVAPTTPTGIVVGVTVRAVTAAYYCWLLKKGPKAVLTNGTLIRGLGVCRSGTTAGAVDVYPLNSVDASGQEVMIGEVMTVGASTEYSLVNFNIW